MIDVARKHQLRIARDTLKMSDTGALIMGGMTKDEARQMLADERKRRKRDAGVYRRVEAQGVK
jgi:hypothetical protein